MSSNASTTITVTFIHPRGAGKFPVEIGPGLTGKQAIDELIKAGFIGPESAARPYLLQLQRTSTSLPLGASLVDSGVKDADVIAIVQPSEGAMPALSPQELRRRLAFDAKVAGGLHSQYLSVRGYTSLENVRAGKVSSPTDAEAGRVVLYEATYAFPMLADEGRSLERAVARFDLLAGGSYPLSAPSVQIVSQPLPWSPHIHRQTGSFCIGSGWNQARGKMLLAQLMVHLMRILNFDEPRHSDAGYCQPAYGYWASTLKYGPLHPELVYPVLPAAITHCVPERPAGFRPLADQPVFRVPTSPAHEVPSTCSFSPVGRH